MLRRPIQLPRITIFTMHTTTTALPQPHTTMFLAEAAKEARVAAEAAWLMQGHRKVAGAARKSRYAHLWPRGATVRPVRSERLYLPEEEESDVRAACKCSPR